MSPAPAALKLPVRLIVLGGFGVGLLQFCVLGLAPSNFNRITLVQCASALGFVVAFIDLCTILQFNAVVVDPVGLKRAVESEGIAFALLVFGVIILDKRSSQFMHRRRETKFITYLSRPLLVASVAYTLMHQVGALFIVVRTTTNRSLVPGGTLATPSMGLCLSSASLTFSRGVAFSAS